MLSRIKQGQLVGWVHCRDLESTTDIWRIKLGCWGDVTVGIWEALYADVKQDKAGVSEDITAWVYTGALHQSGALAVNTWGILCIK